MEDVSLLLFQSVPSQKHSPRLSRKRLGRSAFRLIISCVRLSCRNWNLLQNKVEQTQKHLSEKVPAGDRS